MHLLCINKNKLMPNVEKERPDFSSSFSKTFILFLIPYNMQMRCSSPPTSPALHTTHLLPPPSLLASFCPSFLPSWGLLWKSCHATDMSPYPLWYNSIRFACWPRSGTSNLFSLLIIIGGINKFGWKTTPWTLTLYPWLKFIFHHFFLLLGDK